MVVDKLKLNEEKTEFMLIGTQQQLSKVYIYNIRRIRNFLSFEAAKTLVQALVISRLDYCNSVLYGIPAIHTNKLQRGYTLVKEVLSKTAAQVALGHIHIYLSLFSRK